jgi:integrase
VLAWRTELAGKRKVATVRARVTAISTWCTFLMTLQLLDGNPAAGVRCARVPVYTRARRIDFSEFERILAVIPDTPEGRRDYSLLLTYVLTLRRRSELLRLRWQDLEFRDGVCMYNYTGKRGKGRPRPLPQDAIDAIDEWAATSGREPSARIWPVSASAISKWFKAYAATAKVDVSRVHIHALRHLGVELRAKLMREKNGVVDLEKLQDDLEHSSVATTQVYMVQFADNKDELGDEVGRLFRKRRKGEDR